MPNAAVVPAAARGAAVPLPAARAAGRRLGAGRAGGQRRSPTGPTGNWPGCSNQYSRLGELLDPAADRLYILAALVGFVIRGFIPWWVAALIIGRDVLLAATLPVLRRYGYTALPVHYLGKAATFCLLYGLPMLLLAQGDSRRRADRACRPATRSSPGAW